MARRDPSTASFDFVLPARDPWSYRLTQGQVLRIVDLEGCQAVDTLFYNADDPLERYSAPDTLQMQGNIFIQTGTRLYSSEGRVMLTVLDDTCGRHDTSGGACSAESNSVRYGLDRRHQHSCRDNFLMALAPHGLDKRDIVSNINFFMHVPIEGNGDLAIVDGISAPGSYVEMRAEMNVLVAISNCPQVNNPCNAYNPTPIRLIVWDQDQ
jgi:uncharacterized protein